MIMKEAFAAFVSQSAQSDRPDEKAETMLLLESEMVLRASDLNGAGGRHGGLLDVGNKNDDCSERDESRRTMLCHHALSSIEAAPTGAMTSIVRYDGKIAWGKVMVCR